MKSIAIGYLEGMSYPIINKGYIPNGTIRRVIILIDFNGLGKIKFRMHGATEKVKQVSQKVDYGKDVEWNILGELFLS